MSVPGNYRLSALFTSTLSRCGDTLIDIGQKEWLSAEPHYHCTEIMFSVPSFIFIFYRYLQRLYFKTGTSIYNGRYVCHAYLRLSILEHILDSEAYNFQFTPLLPFPSRHRPLAPHGITTAMANTSRIHDVRGRILLASR